MTGAALRRLLVLALLAAGLVTVTLASWVTTADRGPAAGAAETRPGGLGPGAGPSRAVSPPPSPPALALRRLPGSYSSPVYVTAPPGDPARLFIVEKTGRIRIIRDGALLPDPFLDLSSQVSMGTEQGLLSMAFDPGFRGNGRFYVDYTDTAGDTRVVRYQASTADPDKADPSTGRVLLRVRQPYSNHNGGQLQIGPDGRLYVGMGDGGGAGDPQDRALNDRSRLGKLLRITLGARPRVRIYAKGLRNPWRFSFDRATGDLWIGDVGQDAWEEVDRLKAGSPAGANLGWRGYEGTHIYDRATAARLDRRKLVWPVSQYSHSVGEAVTGGYVYRGPAIPGLTGFYLFADYVTGRVWAKKGAAGRRVPATGLDRQVAHPSSFGEDAAGELYLVSLDGSVYRIVAATP